LTPNIRLNVPENRNSDGRRILRDLHHETNALPPSSREPEKVETCPANHSLYISVEALPNSRNALSRKPKRAFSY
jgi:hypothetical protein